MIPKKIHYCWFGGKPKPKLANKCIASWQKYCPDFEIIEWNESNYSIEKAPLYVQQAYEKKKWAFVSDYVRLQVVYENGGIYFDTDVELQKPITNLMIYDAFFGADTTAKINTGLGYGAVEGHQLVREIMQEYQDIPFILEDGSMDMLGCPGRNTEEFYKYGYEETNRMQELMAGTVAVLPSEYMDPLDYGTGRLKKTKNTISVHWYTASWSAGNEAGKNRRDVLREDSIKQKLEFLKTAPNRLGRKVLGNIFYENIKGFLKGRK